jgi:copper chaperone CopZ
MPTIHLTVEGMHCRRCVRQATALLRDVPGITTLTADLSTGRITLTGNVTEEAVLQALATTTFIVRITATPPPSGLHRRPGPGGTS